MVLFCVFAGEALIQQQQQHHHLTAAAAAPPDIRDALFQTAAMAKKFQLVDTFERRTPTTPTETNWKLCLVCQEETSESLVCPVLSKRRDPGSGYTTMAANLVKFDELGKLPRTVQLQRLDEGQGVEATMVAHQAKWHKTCMLKYNNTMLRRAEKRLIASSSAFGSTDNVPGKRARTHSSEATTSDTSCFFCGKSGTETLHEVATFQVDTRVRKCAAQVGDNELMARLSMGDMVALEAKYHSKCLLALYYRAKTTVEAEQKTDHEGVMSRIVLAELVLYIEETPLEEGTAPVFRLADLAKLYTTRMEQLGVALCKKVTSTRLKERLLAQLPGLRSQSKGRDVLLAFDEDIGEALGKACEQDCDTEAVHLARAAQIVRRYMFEDTGRFRGSFPGGCQEDSVPNVLVAMVNMVLDGPSIKNQSHSSSTQAALSIAQLLKFNSVKQSRKQGATKTQEPPSVRHSSSQETPLPTYVGLMLHAKTRKRGLVDKLFSLGLSISYDRVLRLSAQMGNSVCQLYRIEQVVCPPTLRSNVFTTAAVDNIDHNPSATTAKNSFHGTGISLVQHPTCAEEGVDLYLGSKSDLLVCLEGHAEPQSEAPTVTAVVLDGAVIVQMLKPGTANTFEEYAQQVFIPYVVQQLQHVSRLDSYRADSLKASTREHRGKGVRRRVVDSAVIPGNWQSFLRVDGNKVELFSYLSTMLAESFQEEGKELVVTDGEQVICVPQQEDVNSLAPCNQEEADTRMMLHVAHAAQHGHHQIQVRTVDTDVVVLAVMVVQKLPAGDELWVAFGTGKNYRYIAAHEIASSLGPEKTCALPMFHAITGCDTVSAFVGYGKKSAWATWNTLPELTDALLSLANAPTSIQEDTMHVIERFVILQYDRTSKCKDVNKARKKLFAKKSSVQNIPPTYAALEQHVKRSALQGGHVWGQALVPEPVLPPPTDWGSHRSDDGPYTPLWTTLPEASKTCYELVSCGCKKGCRKRCKCKNASLQCTGLCFCEGECQ